MTCTDCLERVDAYVDGELSAGEARDLAQHLAVCPECARARQDILALSRSIKEGLVRHRAPDVLKARIRSAIAAEPPIRVPTAAPSISWIRIAAGAVLVATLSSAATFAAMRERNARSSLEGEVVASHIRSLIPGHLTDIVSTNQHNVKPWFNGRVDLSPAVPSLDSAGFPLVGGRIDYVGGRVVPATVYSRRQHMINVYAWPAEGGEGRPIKAEHFTERGYNVVRWTSDGIEFWAVSDVNAPELDQFVEQFKASR
jgi:anti-sigma factor RsiW